MRTTGATRHEGEAEMTKISLMMEVDPETLARISAVLSGAPDLKPTKAKKETAAETQQQQQPQQPQPQPQPQPQQQQPQPTRNVPTEELIAAAGRAAQRLGVGKADALRAWVSANFNDASGQPVRSLATVAPDAARVDLLDKLSKIADGSLTI
jgi:transposase-like protein